MAKAKTMTVSDLVKELVGFDPRLEVWVEDPSNQEGFSPVVDVAIGSDEAPAKGDPSTFLVIHIKR